MDASAIIVRTSCPAFSVSPETMSLRTFSSTTRSASITAEPLTSLKTPLRPAIQSAIEKDGEFLFLVGLDSPIWVHYYQVKQSSQVRCFLQMLSRRRWRAFLTEREDGEVEGGDLRIGNTGEELPVEKVFEMRMWGGQWMFLIEVGTVELGINYVEGLGFVDDAVEFCVQKRDWSV